MLGIKYANAIQFRCFTKSSANFLILLSRVVICCFWKFTSLVAQIRTPNYLTKWKERFIIFFGIQTKNLTKFVEFSTQKMWYIFINLGEETFFVFLKTSQVLDNCLRDIWLNVKIAEVSNFVEIQDFESSEALCCCRDCWNPRPKRTFEVLSLIRSFKERERYKRQLARLFFLAKPFAKSLRNSNFTILLRHPGAGLGFLYVRRFCLQRRKLGQRGRDAALWSWFQFPTELGGSLEVPKGYKHAQAESQKAQWIDYLMPCLNFVICHFYAWLC